MKLRHASIRNFKGVRRLDLDLEPQARHVTCLLGDNGSGKTTVLQAIALLLSLATRRTRDPASFNWHGFLPERVDSLGPSSVELDVEFEPEELEAMATLFQQWYDSLPGEWRQSHTIVPPGASPRVTLAYQSGKLSSPQGWSGVNQFLGRYYIKALMKTDSSVRLRFRSVGDVFWFDQYRNLGSALTQDDQAVESWQAGVTQYREFLVVNWAYHMSKQRGGKDYIPDLERLFSRIFERTKFVGVRPREMGRTSGVEDSYFLLERDGKEFDVAEMSSGEQAVFPLIYEFVRLEIARSIVLIDELELHLHPPQQQALLAALPKLGPDCQFMISSHSSFLSEVVPAHAAVRLEEGALCL
jgi:energy-coupling factor transporter ATP-binding protein EcfA2